MEKLELKTKIGLVVVSASTISELRYHKAAPPGVGFFTSRMMLGGDGGIQALLEMEGRAVRAVGELASAKVDAVAYCCTVSGALRGLEKDQAFCHDMESQYHTPTTSTMLAVTQALRNLGMSKVVVTSPYPDSHHESEAAYLREAGIEAVSMRGMGLETPEEFAAVAPDEIYRFSLDAWNDWHDQGGTADGMFVSCMNFDAMAAAQALEEATGKPVVTSHSATLWSVLGLAGVAEPVLGYGSLLAQERASDLNSLPTRV